MVGSIPALGAWEVSRPLLMGTDLDSYPIWTCHFDSDEADDTLEFKFLKLTNQADGQKEAEWEDIRANRTLDVRQRASIVVEYSFG